MRTNNIEKRLEGRSDGSTAKELIKLAEKDPVHHIDLELSVHLKEHMKRRNKMVSRDQWRILLRPHLLKN